MIEKTGFEWRAEEKRLERKATEKRQVALFLVGGVSCTNGNQKATTEKLRVEPESIEALAVVQSATLNQAGHENIVAMIRIPELSDFVNEKDNWIIIYCDLRDLLPLRFSQRIIWQLGVVHCLLIQH